MMFFQGTKNIQYTSEQLDKYRNKQILTLEEQKEFIDLKFGKKIPGKFSWWSIPKAIPTILLIILLFMGYRYLIGLSGWDIPIWWALILVIIGPIIYSIILKIFGLTDNNVLVDLFWRTKK